MIRALDAFMVVAATIAGGVWIVSSAGPSVSAVDPGDPGGGGGAQTNPEVAAILDAIDANLLALGTSMTADFQCVDSAGRLTAINGTLAAKGRDKLRLNFGSANAAYVHDAVQHNMFKPTLDPGACVGLRWDDPAGTAVMAAAMDVGLVDLRAVLHLARHCQAELQPAPGTEIVNGVVCKKIAKQWFAIWVDASAFKRVIRVTMDFGAGVGALADYSAWVVRGPSGGELPTIYYTANLQNGVTIAHGTYSISNVQIGAACPDAWFATLQMPWLP